MGLKRNVSLGAALRYKGQGPMWSFILHRIGGVGMAVFITLHILASFIGGRSGVFINTLYEHRLFQIFIFFSALFHAINALRITIIDLFSKLLVHRCHASWLELTVFIPLFAAAVFVIVPSALAG